MSRGSARDEVERGRKAMPANSRISFKMMSFIHETLYGLFRDPYKALAAAGVEPGLKVLELGCGPGFFTVPAAEMVGERGSVTALDINPLAVERVRQKIEEAGVANAEVIRADAAETHLPDQSVDLVLLFGFARPIGDMGSIWAEVHRVLRPGGGLSVEGRLRPPERLFHLERRQGRIVRYRRVRPSPQ
jgi:ubiquinone/menaquinone biosynthesis C-methylase UbiE